jgi:hypothetical protein
MSVAGNLRRIVADGARHRCEYCDLAQAGQEAAFHVNRGCRRRRTPPSVRFLGRRVYVGFVLVAAMQHR